MQSNRVDINSKKPAGVLSPASPVTVKYAAISLLVAVASCWLAALDFAALDFAALDFGRLATAGLGYFYNSLSAARAVAAARKR